MDRPFDERSKTRRPFKDARAEILPSDAIASELPRYGDANGDGWAEVIGTLTMYPDVRRQSVRLLAEIGAR
jgi:hypothetical protein